jgi:probable selenium-dependent hydroxylase accessory protein YqeC
MDLIEALAIAPGDVVAFVGGGGKTTAMYRLCAEAAARGLRAVASGTARFTEPARSAPAPLLVDPDERRLRAEIARSLQDSPWVIAATGRGPKGRLLPISYGLAGRLAADRRAGLLVLEADGSALRPFKAPAEHEPALPPSATLVVAVAGADVLGRPLDSDSVHRPERVAALTGAAQGAPVTPPIVAAVLASEQGGRKSVPPGARFAALLNKVTEGRLGAARETAALLQARGVDLVVLAEARRDPPVVAVVHAAPLERSRSLGLE